MMTKLKLYGNPDAPEMYLIRDFLKRSMIAYDLSDVREDKPEVTNRHDRFLLNDLLPAVQFPDGYILYDPSLEKIADYLGLLIQPSLDEYDLSILGAGPAGLSAAVYAASEGLKTILIEREAIGGQAGTSSLIENYMGFPEGIKGAELAERARLQALKFGVEIILLKEGIKGTFKNNRIRIDLKGGGHLAAKSMICATGVTYNKLHLANEDAFLHCGLYYGAGASEANFCKGRDIFIIGGGNSAGQAASYFSGFAAQVYLVIRKDNLRDTLSYYLIKRVTSIRNITNVSLGNFYDTYDWLCGRPSPTVYIDEMKEAFMLRLQKKLR